MTVPPRYSALLFQQLAQETLGRLRIAPALHEDIQHHPVLVHRTPEPVLHPRDRHRHRIKVPLVASTGQPASASTGVPTAQASSATSDSDSCRDSCTSAAAPW